MMMMMNSCAAWLALLLVMCRGVSSDNCWNCLRHQDYVWCTASQQCIHRNSTECTFTRLTECCHTLTTCRSCIGNAFCGWCERIGCRAHDIGGLFHLNVTPADCPTSFHYTRCPAVNRATTTYQVSFVNLILGLSSTIGGGLALSALLALLFWLRKQARKRKAKAAYRHYLRETQLRSCGECQDMLATVRCSVCSTQFCKDCAERSNCIDDTESHQTVPISSSTTGLHSGYQSLAFLRATAGDD